MISNNNQLFKKIRANKLSFYGLGFTVVFGFLSLFQNCSNVTKSGNDQQQNPNLNPLTAVRTANGVTVEPGLAKKITVDGVNLENYPAGVFVNLIVKDECILNRKDQIKKQLLYISDEQALKNFDFTKPVGRFGVSVFRFQTSKPVAADIFGKAIRADECIENAIVTQNNIESIIKSSNVTATQTSLSAAYADLGLTDAVLLNLSALHNNTKVKTGIVVDKIFKVKNVNYDTFNVDTILWGNVITEDSYVISALAGGVGGASNPAAAGMAKNVTEIIPVAVQGFISGQSLFNSIRELVNRGAEIIYVPQQFVTKKDSPDYCDPIVGQAYFYAIERNVTIIVQAGTENVDGVGPGEISGPRDFKLWEKSQTNHYSCWSRYFRGVISVASKNLGEESLTANTNWGAEGIEIAATGVQIPTFLTEKAYVNSSPAAAGSVITAAAVHAISLFKSKNWFISPWLIEDVIMKSSTSSTSSHFNVKPIRLNKIFKFDQLLATLTDLAKGSESATRNLASDNPESGQSINASSILNGEKPIRLDVFTKISDAFYKDRNQFQAVYYYASGAVKVVTNQVSWSSSNSTNYPIDSAGVVAPTVTGSYTITAKDLATGLTGTATASAVDYNRVSGKTSELIEIFLVPKKSPFDFQNKSLVQTGKTSFTISGTEASVATRARYQDGSIRAITGYATYVFSARGQVLGSNSPADSGRSSFDVVDFGRGVTFYGGEYHDLTVFYQGNKSTFKFFVEPYEFLGLKWDVIWNPYTFPKDYSVSEPSKTVVAVSESSRKYYLGTRPDSLNSLNKQVTSSHKIPLCRFANGLESQCYFNTWTGDIHSIDLRSTYQAPVDWAQSTLYTVGKSLSDFVLNQMGKFTLSHKYTFRGNGIDEIKTDVVNIEVIEAATQIKAVYSRFNLKTDFPLGDTYINDNQLLPICLNVGFRLMRVNEDIGIKNLYKEIDPLKNNPQQASVSMFQSNLEINSVTSSIGYDGFLVKQPTFPLTIKVKHIEAVNEISGSLTKNAVNDPNLSNLNGFANFTNSGYATVKTLPPLPSIKLINPLCNATTVNSSGFKSGSGIEADPYLICNISDLKNAVKIKSTVITQFFKLGQNIDLTGIQPTLLASGGFAYFDFGDYSKIDGDMYRIFGINFIDRESLMSILISNSVKNLIFTDNLITVKELVLLKSKAENIYAYNNTLEAEIFSGISITAKNVYTSNIVSYLRNANSLAATNITSFSNDTVRFIGLVGDGYYSGLGSISIYSGSNSKIFGGRNISGVAGNACYKCFSAVDILAPNASIVGGITAEANVGLGTIEIGDSEAKINVASTNAVVGGLIGKHNLLTANVYAIFPIDGRIIKFGFGHLNIVNSSFSGSITTGGIASGVIGIESTYSNIYFTNVTVSGTMNSSASKVANYIGSISSRCHSESRILNVRSSITNSNTTVAVDDYYGAKLLNSQLVSY